jgi:hypothetical protein
MLNPNKIMRKLFILILLQALIYPKAFGQIGGEATYDFLNLTNSARMAALGGNQVALSDSLDLNVSFNNPSLLRPASKNMLALNYMNYFAGINYGYAAYSFDTPLPGNFAVGMQYINYGEFIEALPNGERTGLTFNAAEYALNIIWSNEIKWGEIKKDSVLPDSISILNQDSLPVLGQRRLAYGINLKPILSSFESYQSIGLAADLGLSYFSRDGHTVAALVARNIGTQLTTYYDGAGHEPCNTFKNGTWPNLSRIIQVQQPCIRKSHSQRNSCDTWFLELNFSPRLILPYGQDITTKSGKNFVLMKKCQP